MTPDEEDQLAATVVCPQCKVAAGQQCVNIFDPRKARAMPHALRLHVAIDQRLRTTETSSSGGGS